MEIGQTRKVTIVERVAVERSTVQGLLEAVEAVMRKKPTPTAFQYLRGEDLVVERQVDTGAYDDDDVEFHTAYAAMRAYTDMDVVDTSPGQTPLDLVAEVAERMSEEKYQITALICKSSDAVRAWLGGRRIDRVFNVPMHEDPECPEDQLGVCGSKTGKLLGHLERSFVCRMG